MSSNAMLTNLNGLQNITSVNQYIDIIDNSSLVNLNGLNNITSAGDLRLIDNSSLANIDELSKITSLLSLSITNSSITNLDALSNLQSVYLLTIQDNNLLTSFCGLYKSINSGLVYSYDVSGNAVNPTQQDIIDGGSCSDSTNVQSLTYLSPQKNSLEQNYPNPFQKTTFIKYFIQKPGHVTLTVYDIYGKEVESLVDNEEPAGILLCGIFPANRKP